MTRYVTSVVAVGMIAGLAAGADLKSGLEPGQSVPVFTPLNITGPKAGEKQCPI